VAVSDLRGNARQSSDRRSRAVVHAVLFYDHATLWQHKSDTPVKGCLTGCFSTDQGMP
jgi:hypothetical protein